jgi:hypothetical protein
MNEADDPVLRPFKSVVELIKLAVNSGWRSVRFGLLNPLNNMLRIYRRMIVSLRWRRRWDRNDRTHPEREELIMEGG